MSLAASISEFRNAFSTPGAFSHAASPCKDRRGPFAPESVPLSGTWLSVLPSRRHCYACAGRRFPPRVLLVPHDFLALDVQHALVPKDDLHPTAICMLDHRNAVPEDSHPVAAFEP